MLDVPFVVRHIEIDLRMRIAIFKFRDSGLIRCRLRHVVRGISVMSEQRDRHHNETEEHGKKTWEHTLHVDTSRGRKWVHPIRFQPFRDLRKPQMPFGVKQSVWLKVGQIRSGTKQKAARPKSVRPLQRHPR
jgi:hypothetical protein